VCGAAVALVLLLGSAPARAAAAERLFAAAPTDSAATDASRPAAAKAKEPPFSAPGWVMARSLVVPGWGQATNHAWFKAIGIGVGEVALMFRIVDDQHALNQLDAVVQAARAADDLEAEEIAVAAYNDRLNGALTRQWLLGGLIAYSMADAYVDAHFRHFKIEFERDPALPAGKPAELGLRVGGEWRF